MIIPSTRLFTAGEIETGSFLNSSITNLGNFLLGKPVAVLRQATAQSLAVSGTNYTLTFDTEDVDRDNGHSISTNTSRYTAQTAGYYFVAGQASFAGNVTGSRIARLSVNGTLVNYGAKITSSTLNTNACILPVESLLYLSVGDYVEISVNQTSGAALNTFVTAPYQSFMSIIWVSV